ncbi:zinc ribbon domain-containing protein [Actinomadura parmotrematis]|uniref:Zinc ribbon domain-containing protein n=1 Tax=Actinomadura parmotrematis TaxID=2864039 RepID=A0ABS7G4H0_9ACTN|nr:zinc ribbon domain-containing protein [Actinomadura parmotrematis]MBW8487627.1 zinc ribbon domain-containing protein [Actinomadura parmotrematis]
MLIIFGLRVLLGTIGTGVFHCPQCGGDREYRLRRGRNWFTLFFIPVIPLNRTGGEIVECGTCHGRWTPGVLTVPTAAHLATVPATLVRLAVAQALRSGDVTHGPARDRAVAAVHRAGDPAYDGTVLDADMARPFDQVRAEMARGAGVLAPQVREDVLRAAAEVALADGPLTVSEEETLGAVGADLDLTRVQVTGVLALARQDGGR